MYIIFRDVPPFDCGDATLITLPHSYGCSVISKWKCTAATCLPWILSIMILNSLQPNAAYQFNILKIIPKNRFDAETCLAKTFSPHLQYI